MNRARIRVSWSEQDPVVEKAFIWVSLLRVGFGKLLRAIFFKSNNDLRKKSVSYDGSI